MTCTAKLRKLVATPGPTFSRPCCTMLRRPPPFMYEPETIEFFEAIEIPRGFTIYYEGTPQEITGTGLWDAVNDFALALKTIYSLPTGVDNLSTVMRAIYLIIGGDAAKHKYNFVDPQDTDGAFRLSFFGGAVHSRTGLLFSPSDGYGDTHLVPNTTLSFASNHLSFYNRTNNADQYDMGASNDAGAVVNEHILITKYNPTGGVGYYSADGLYNCSVAVADSRGWFLGSKGATATQRLYRNGVQIASAASAGSALSTQSIHLNGLNAGGTNAFRSAHQCAFASIGPDITAIQAPLWYTAVQTLQSTLGRAI